MAASVGVGAELHIVGTAEVEDQGHLRELAQFFLVYIYIYNMGPGPGLVAHVLWRYCMRLASSGVGGVRRVRLALLYVGSCVGVLWMMFWMRLAS